VTRWALTSSVPALLLGVMSTIGLLLMWLYPPANTGALMLMGSLPGTVLSFVALTLSTYRLPDWLFLRRSVMFLSLGLNCFPWVILLSFIMTFGFGPGA
jgi:ABC-type transport system involved in multi-copper enzyme maturation permease subunit